MSTHADINRLIALWCKMISLDREYAEHQTPETNAQLVCAQRAYYAELAHFDRAHYRPDEARYRTATALLRRAMQNRKRLPHDSEWQEMAAYQVQRATRIRAHAMALWDDYKPDTQRRLEQEVTTHNHTPKPTKPKRTIHPITRRYVYTQKETD